MNNFWLLIFLIFIGQTLGALIGIIRKPSKAILQWSLAFAASMMISITFLNLIPEALIFTTPLIIVLSFVFGVLTLVLAEKILPHFHPELFNNPDNSMAKSIAMLVVGMGLHNIPEGLAVGAGFAASSSLGIAIAISMTIQDVPENIAVIIPIYNYLKNRLTSFLLVAGTVLFQLFGFLFGFFVLKDANPAFIGMALAAAGGFMFHISIDELIPAAKINENKKLGWFGLISGFLVVLIVTLLTSQNLYKI
ncbi:MAG: ZIP family metal transporter [Candidatus Altiarchaeota archaeon]|nr:ZIP family metal transporter [Candidatus Altiarchaeota archaeon]